MTTTLTAHEPQDPDHLLAHAFDDRDVDVAGGADGAMELTSIPPLPPRTSWTPAPHLTRTSRSSRMPSTPHSDLPEVLSESALSNAFLGKIVEVCLVTADHQRTMEGLVRLGVGPFRVYTFDSGNVADQTYAGQGSPFSLQVCFATHEGLTFEIMQPLSGRTVIQDFLDEHGEGVHHLAFDCNGAPWDRRIAMFEERGFPVTQSGRWLDQNAFSFFGTEAATTTCFETYHFPDGFTYPAPDRWFPGPPPGTAST